MWISSVLNQEAMYIAIVIRTILSAHSLGKEDKRTWTMNSGLTGSNRRTSKHRSSYKYSLGLYFE